MPEKQTVYVVGAPHSTKERRIRHAHEIPTQLELVSRLVRNTGANKLFHEGNDRVRCDALEDTINYYRDRLKLLDEDIDICFRTGDFERWQGFQEARTVLKLRQEGHPVAIEPAEQDRSSIDLVVNFFANQVSQKDWALLGKYGIDVLGGVDAMVSVLRNISASGDREKLTQLLCDVRVHYGDKEMAKNIKLFGADKNILIVGSGHTQSGWESEFNKWKLTVAGEPGKNLVHVSGFMPENLRSVVRPFRIPGTYAEVKTDKVEFVAQ